MRQKSINATDEICIRRETAIDIRAAGFREDEHRLVSAVSAQKFVTAEICHCKKMSLQVLKRAGQQLRAAAAPSK